MNCSNKSVLITGGFGFIGQNLVKRLTKLNTNITILDNFSYGKRDNLKSFNGKIVEASTLDKNIDQLVNDDIDIIFHFGAPSSVILFNSNPLEMYANTTVGFLNVMNLARKKKIEKIVYPSSGSIYGTAPSPQSEKTIPEPVNLYAVAKLSCEQIASLYPDVKSTGLRIFAGYGPGEDHKGEIASPVSLFLKSIIKNESPIVFGDGTQTRDFVYITDVVDAILNSAGRNTPSIINVGSGISYSFNEVIISINELLGKEIKPKYIKKPLSYLENTLAETTILKNSLGIEPMSLKEGLSDYIQQYQAKKDNF